MRWKPISELTPDTDVLFRIEFDNGQPVVFVCGCVWRERLYIDNDNNTFDDFDGVFLCRLSNLKKRNIKSIYFIDPKEIKLIQ